MSEELINHYKADEREAKFLLFEQFNVGELLGRGKYADFTRDDIEMVLGAALQFAQAEIGPLNGYGDRTGCSYDPKTFEVKVPPLMKELHGKFLEQGWHLMRVSQAMGGQGLPYAASLLASEYITGASAAWMMYSGLTLGAAHLVETHGTEEQKALFCEKMYMHEWMGTMCLTEPGAGSDVGRSTCKAKKNDDGTYSISGVKCFISGGDHDLSDNIIHMVLARVEGAAEGTAGLSLFIIPKVWVNPDGSLGEFNDVICRGIEKKMGIHASATCTLNFGDNGKCRGLLLGPDENKGMKTMFQMMNEARIGTGMQALATASSAYLNAVSYARDRVQGKRFTDMAQRKEDTASVNIIEHEDVRRMLLEMKCKTEGCRMMAVKLAQHLDRAELSDSEDEKKKHMGYIELMTPLVKAYLSDQGFRVAELAIQTYGGYGYISDYPVEQYCRDIKIQSLYEGTNFIQSLDLVGRKLNMQGGALLKTFLGDLYEFTKTIKDDEVFKNDAKALKKAADSVGNTAMQYMQFFGQGKARLIPLTSTRFLEMLSEVSVAWLLLEAAVISHKKLEGMEKSDADWAFYMGKVHSAQFFIRNILPGCELKAQIIAAGDTSALELDLAEFPENVG